MNTRQWDRELGFALFALGATVSELARKFDVSASTVCEVVRDEDWKAKRDEYLKERALRVTTAVSKEQEFLKSMEADRARKLLGLGDEMLRTLTRSPKTDVADLCRVYALASELGRRATGMPLQAIELSVSHDLTEDIKRMLDKAYGDAPAQVTDSKPVIEAEVVQDLTQQVVVRHENVK